MSDGGLPDIPLPRGRARSRTFSSDDSEFTAEIDVLHGIPTEQTPEDATAKAQAAMKAPLSRKTMKIVSTLDEQPQVEEDEEAPKKPPQLSEEEAAELELAEQEKKRRAQDAAAAEGAGSGAASAPARRLPAPGGGGASAGGAGGRRKPDDKDYDIQIKLLLLGDSGVGKTSLMLRYSEDKFSSSMLSTAGVDFKVRYLDVDGVKVKCQIWDTAGQQRFHVITHSYYKSAHGIVLVYDASDGAEGSFSNVRYWMENITKHANPLTQRILIGNKIDVKPKRIDTAKGKALADEYGMRFYETSAKDGTGVTDAFAAVARDIVAKSNAMAAAEGGGDGGGAGKAGGKGGKKDGKDCVIQ